MSRGDCCIFSRERRGVRCSSCKRLAGREGTTPCRLPQSETEPLFGSVLSCGKLACLRLTRCVSMRGLRRDDLTACSASFVARGRALFLLTLWWSDTIQLMEEVSPRPRGPVWCVGGLGERREPASFRGLSGTFQVRSVATPWFFSRRISHGIL